MAKQALTGATRSNLFKLDPSDPQVLIVGIDTDAKSTNDHPLWDRRVLLPVDEALTLNMMVYGMIDPVKIRKEGDVYMVVDGRQRLRACREADKRLRAEGKEGLRAKFIIERGDDAFMYGVMVSANENRQDDDVMVKAEKASTLMAMGKSMKETAVAFGVTEQAVRNWLSLQELAPEVKAKVKSGVIAPSAAAKLAPLGRDEQIAALEEMEAAGTVTTAQAAAQTRVRKAKKEGKDETKVASLAPKKRQVKKLLDLVAEMEDSGLDPEFIKGIRWAIGDLHTNSIKGLTALYNEANGK